VERPGPVVGRVDLPSSAFGPVGPDRHHQAALVRARQFPGRGTDQHVALVRPGDVDQGVRRVRGLVVVVRVPVRPPGLSVRAERGRPRLDGLVRVDCAVARSAEHQVPLVGGGESERDGVLVLVEFAVPPALAVGVDAERPAGGRPVSGLEPGDGVPAVGCGDDRHRLDGVSRGFVRPSPQRRSLVVRPDQQRVVRLRLHVGHGPTEDVPPVGGRRERRRRRWRVELVGPLPDAVTAAVDGEQPRVRGVLGAGAGGASDRVRSVAVRRDVGPLVGPVDVVRLRPAEG